MVDASYPPKRTASSQRLYAFGLGLIVITVAAAALSMLDLYRNAIDNYRQGMANVGVLLAEHTSGSIRSLDLVLEEINRDVTVAATRSPEDFRQRLESEAMHAYLADRAKHLPNVTALTVVGADGKLLNSSRIWPVPKISAADRDYFMAARGAGSDALIISAPLHVRTLDGWMLVTARRIASPDGAFLGVSMALVAVRSFQEFFQAITLMDGASVTLLRRDGMMLARYPQTENMMGKLMPADSPWYERAARDGGNYRSPGYLDGIVREVGVYPLKDYPLVIDVTVPLNTALAHWRWQTTFIGIATLGAVIGFALLFWSLAAQVSRLERSEQALADAVVEAENASRAKSDFLAHMSHELRTPLNAIIGFSEVMTAGLFGPLGSPRYEDYAKDIHRSGRYLHDLISDMLDMAKIEAGRHDLCRTPFAFVSEIEDIVRMVGPQATARLITIALDVIDAPAVLIADRRAFKQIMLNLLGNAVKFTPANGKITVGVTKSGRDLTIRVIDTGVGIAANKLDRLGTPFFRVDDPSHASTEGTGLGLALTKSLIKLHDWQMTIQSEAGSGTTVTIAIPDGAGSEFASRKITAVAEQVG